MASQIASPSSILGRRILALVMSVCSVVLLASANFKLSGVHYGFQNIVTFRYVMAVAVISIAYGVMQLPFAAYYDRTQKRVIPQRFEFYADMVMSVLLATSSGAGIAVSHELKRGFGGGNNIGINSNNDYHDYYDHIIIVDSFFNFFIKLLVASVLLLLVWLSLAVISIISYNKKHRQSNSTLEPSPITEPAVCADVKASSDGVCV
ncbi:CASP-like protein 4D1 [Prosopis cineraria]|uniref:CASP-like protein 4D1 n=1 Tax=Prosopis cineraria TaxID=364024 RepID=UPI00240ED163|nr:CASP-like protein 4D1 [Prosopis cineraria]